VLEPRRFTIPLGNGDELVVTVEWDGEELNGWN